MNAKTYPRTNDSQTIYLNTVIRNPNITVGDYTIYNNFVNDPTLFEKNNVLYHLKVEIKKDGSQLFEKNNVLYHYPINGDRLIIGKFCSIACGAKFLFNSANHSLKSLSGYTFPSFSRSGIWTRKMSLPPGTTRGTSSSATMSGSVMKPSSWQAYTSATEPSSLPGQS